MLIFFSIGANEATLIKFAQEKNTDPHFKTLFAHTLLCGLSSQSVVSPSIIEATAQIIFNQKAQEPGTTLGMAIGYTLGRLLYNGNDVRPFLKICTPTYVHSYKLFLNGFNVGCHTNAQGLMHNSNYVGALKERYEDWNSDSFNTCKKLYALTGEQNNFDHAQINPLNEKITSFLQAFFPDNSLINTLHEAHIEKLSFINSKTLESPEIALAVDQLVTKRSNALVSEIEKNYDKKLAKETAKLNAVLQAGTDRLTQRIESYDKELAAEVARIEKQAIDNAHIILEQQKVIKETQERNEQSLAFKSKLNKML